MAGKFPTGAFSAVLLLMAGIQSAHAYVITMAPGSAYDPNTAAMDTALGISGLTTEDFEDVNLVSGLTIQHTNPDGGPTNTLSNLYTQPDANFNDNYWAGNSALVNTPDNTIWFPPIASLNNISESVTFLLDDSASQFGVGLGNFQADLVDHMLMVNGVEQLILESLANFNPGVNSNFNIRNGYLLINAESGESISSVTIQLRANGGTDPINGPGSDGLIFDHVAFGGTPTQIPEPGTVALLGIGLLGYGFIRRRRAA